MFSKAVLAFCVLLLAAESAWAYVGPGADVAFISYAMTLLIWVLTMFSAVLLWPFYALVRRLRGRGSQAEPGNQEKPTPSPIERAVQEARAANHSDP